MADPLTIAGDIASAATALAGLLLVFIGAVTAGFESYPKQDQTAVLEKFRRRGNLALGGFITALAAAALSLVGKWLTVPGCVFVALALLGFSFVLVTIAGVKNVGDIK